MAPSVDPFYGLYMNKGFVPIEIITSGIIAIICCVAIGLNSSLVYVTIKTTSLHSPCKILLCIGIDRLIGVIFPIWYKTSGKYLTFKFIIGICCIRSIINGFNTYIGSSAHWEKPVMCLLGDPSQQPENQYYTNISAFIIYCGEFLCYALIWLIIWHQKSSIPEKVKKLTISLSVFMSIGLLCNILNTIFSKVIMPLLNFDAFTIEYFVLPISLSLQSMAYGSTTPVLYFCNEQYRTAFRRPVETTTLSPDNKCCRSPDEEDETGELRSCTPTPSKYPRLGTTTSSASDCSILRVCSQQRNQWPRQG
uniref:Uncharacterized protein n=1 Tax=Globodera rostochiensis TaxID=31243 RepID=A0A914H7G8_GLORO